MFLEKYSQYAIPLILAAILVFNDIKLFMYVDMYLDNNEKEINVRSPLLAYFLVLAATLLVTTEFIFDYKLFASYHTVCESILQFLFGMFVFDFVTQFFWKPIEHFTYHTLPKTVEKLADGEECLFNLICHYDCTPYTLFLYAFSWFLFYCSLKRFLSSPESYNYNYGSTANNFYSTNCRDYNNNYFNSLNVSSPLPSNQHREGTRLCDISRQEQDHNKSPSCELISCHKKSTGQKSKKKNNSKKNATSMIRSRQKSPRKSTGDSSKCMNCIYNK